MIPIGKTWIMAALGGILAGLGGCGAADAPPAVPGAPGVDPAGVPAAAGEKAQGGEKHACASNGSCGGMNETKDEGKGKKDPAPPSPPLSGPSPG